MAALAHTTPAPCAQLPANDNPPGDPCTWHQVIRVFTSFSDELGAIAWKARLQGGTALAFLEEILEARAANQAARGAA